MASLSYVQAPALVLKTGCYFTSETGDNLSGFDDQISLWLSC